MSLELFCAPESLCSQKVKLVLAEKQLVWKSHSLNLLTFDNLQPNYIRLNPKGVVPTLIHEGRVITDSAVIVRYLDEQFPHPSLVPAEPGSKEKMNNWIALQNQFPTREMIYGNAKGIEGAVLRRSVRLKEKLLPQLMQSNPELIEQYTAKLNDVRRWRQAIDNRVEIENLNAKIAPLLDELEVALTQAKWLCGSHYSLADTVWTAVLHRMEQLHFDYLWKDSMRPALEVYFNRLKSRPSFAIIQTDKTPLPMLVAGLWRIAIGV